MLMYGVFSMCAFRGSASTLVEGLSSKNLRWYWPLMLSVRPCSGISCCRLRKIDFFALTRSKFIKMTIFAFCFCYLLLCYYFDDYGSIDYVEHFCTYRTIKMLVIEIAKDAKTFLLLAIQVLSLKITKGDCCDCYYSRCNLHLYLYWIPDIGFAKATW